MIILRSLCANKSYDKACIKKGTLRIIELYNYQICSMYYINKKWFCQKYAVSSIKFTLHNFFFINATIIQKMTKWFIIVMIFITA